MDEDADSLNKRRAQCVKAAKGLLPYAVALVSVGLALCARLVLDPFLRDVQPFPTFYLTVCLVSWCLGWRPALLVLVLGYFIGDWFFVAPRDSLAVQGLDEWMHMLAYGFVSGTTVFIIHQMQTAEKRAKIALEKRESELKQAERLAQLGSWTWRTKTDTVRWSEELYRIAARELGVPVKGYRDHLQIFVSETRESMDSALWRTLASGEPCELDLEVLCPDGTRKAVTARGEATFDSKGSIVGLRGTIQDITQRKRGEQALREAVEELDHFSYSLIHDLRAPLRALQGFTTVLERDCHDCQQERSRDFHRRISEAASRMDNLIVDALNYSHALRMELPLAPVDLSRLLRGILEGYPNLVGHRSEISVEGKLPTVLGNEAGLTQCFSNLLHNAITFAVPGSRPDVRVWAEEARGFVRVWVEDKGIGIPQHVQNRLFGLFQRHNTQHRGTGCGLAIARKMTVRMGGKIGVESELNKGSRFWIELPSVASNAQRTQAQLG